MTIARWQESGKQVPLHWNHGSKAEDIIGSVDPQTMIETEAGLFIEATSTSTTATSLAKLGAR